MTQRNTEGEDNDMPEVQCLYSRDDATLWCQETDSRDAAHSSYLALLELIINGATNEFQVARSH